MKARDVIGRTIVRVDHERFYNHQHGRLETVVARLVLDDGSTIYAHAFETEGDIAATMYHNKSNRRKK